MASRRHLWLSFTLLSIIMLAAFLRMWRLDSLPPGLYHDEAYYGLDALSLLQGKTFPQFYEGWEQYAQDAHAARPATPTRFPVFFEGNYGREPLHVYLVALSIRLFGATPLAIRAVAAFAGTLAVLTTYLAARALFPPDRSRVYGGEFLPLFAAFTLAVLYPAITFSRFGIRAMTMLPCVTLAVFAFWSGYRSAGGRSAVWYGLAGFFVGLSLYTFASARLFPLVFVLFGFYWFLRDRTGFLASWRQLVVAILVALGTAAPLLIFFARYPYFFFFRIAYVANRGAGVVEDSPLQTWLMNIGRVLLGLFWRGETHLRHNLPGRPYLDPVQAILAGLGLWVAIRTIRRYESVFLLIWFVVMLLPSILSGDAPHFGRLTGVAAPVAILVAVGAEQFLEFLTRRLPQQRRVVPSIIAALVAFSLTLTVRDYFGRYASHPDLARDFYRDDWEMGQFAARQPAETTLYLTPPQEEMATIFFALADPQRLHSFNGEDGLVAAGITGHPSLYLVRPDAVRTAELLQERFPDGQWVEAQAGFKPFFVSTDDGPAPLNRPAIGSFDDLVDLTGYEINRRPDSIDVQLIWQAKQSLLRDYTIFVHLLDNEGTLVTQADRPPTGYPTSQWRPGEFVVDTLRVPLPSDLAPGTYTLTTGFYYLPTLERLGKEVRLEDVVVTE